LPHPLIKGVVIADTQPAGHTPPTIDVRSNNQMCLNPQPTSQGQSIYHPPPTKRLRTGVFQSIPENKAGSKSLFVQDIINSNKFDVSLLAIH
jgi:hypothetical protein